LGQKGQPQPAPQRAAAYPLHQPRRLHFRGGYQLAGLANHYKIVMLGKINVWGNQTIGQKAAGGKSLR
jgi:hypothetical protein